MNLTVPDDSDLRKQSIFSILSETSFNDYTHTSHTERTASLSAVLRTLQQHKQHSRIELADNHIEINRDVLSWAHIKHKYSRTGDDIGVDDNDNNNNDNYYDYNNTSSYQAIKHRVGHYCKKSWAKVSLVKTLVTVLPVIQWLRHYSFRNNIAYDLLAGLTLAMVIIPEAMANGYLSGMGPEYGLYVAFFPSLIYTLMGTSHHTAIGTFSITSIMISDVVLRSHEYIYDLDVDTGNHTLVSQEFSSLQIVSSLCLLCGLIQFLMCCLNLGVLSLLLSDTIASAFLSSAALQVIAAYFPTIFDVDLPPIRYSLFRIFKQWIAFFTNLSQVNYISLGISIAAIICLILVRQLLEPMLKRKFAIKIPFPIEIIIVVIMTLISWSLDLSAKHIVAVVGDVPNGIPVPVLPTLKLFSVLIWDALIISIVSYVVSVSMAKTFAVKHRYKINANQELLAMGAANIFALFFNCYTSSSSLTRSSVLDKSGARSPMATLFATILLLIVILFLNPLVYYLPKCALSAIILVAMKSMFVQALHVRRVFKHSKVEALTWIITFAAVISLDVDLGLLIAILLNGILVLIKLSKPYTAVMGRLSSTELYADVNHYRDALVVKGIQIFHFSCPLIFLNRHTFKEKLYQKVFNISSHDINIYPCDDMRAKSQINTVIIDCTAIFYVDSSGTQTLIEIISELKRFGIRVLFAGGQHPVLVTLAKIGPDLHDTDVYASVHDAVIKCISRPAPPQSHNSHTSDV